MGAGEASVALVAAIAFFILGLGLILNPADLTARMHHQNVEWWSRRSSASRSWGYVQEWIPLWVVRYGVGLWFCVLAVALAIAVGRSL